MAFKLSLDQEIWLRLIIALLFVVLGFIEAQKIGGFAGIPSLIAGYMIAMMALDIAGQKRIIGTVIDRAYELAKRNLSEQDVYRSAVNEGGYISLIVDGKRHYFKYVGEWHKDE